MARFAKWHPLVQFCFFLCVLLLTCLSRHPVPVALSLLGAAVYLLLTDGRRSLRSLLCVPVLVALVGGFNFLFAHWGVTVLFSRGDTQFTLESLVYGCFQGAYSPGWCCGWRCSAACWAAIGCWRLPVERRPAFLFCFL